MAYEMNEPMARQTSARTRKQFGLVMDDTADKHDITNITVANLKRK